MLHSKSATAFHRHVFGAIVAKLINIGTALEKIGTATQEVDTKGAFAMLVGNHVGQDFPNLDGDRIDLLPVCGLGDPMPAVAQVHSVFFSFLFFILQF